MESNMVNVIGGRYKIGDSIGRGSNGVVYDGTEILTGKKVAIKIEHSNIGLLKLENKYYQSLAGGIGIPRVHWFDEKTEGTLVLDILDKSLQERIRDCRGRFTLKTTVMLARQLVSRLQYIHGKSIIHRDIKPENILMCGGVVNVVDFGLACYYRDPATHKHSSFTEVDQSMGTIEFASIPNLMKYEQSRRDDLECLWYTLVYFLNGSLPWQDLPDSDWDTWCEAVKQKKIGTGLRVLCQWLPPEFYEYICYVRGLGFNEEPDYIYLADIFERLVVRKKFTDDDVFDWDMLRICNNQKNFPKTLCEYYFIPKNSW